MEGGGSKCNVAEKRRRTENAFDRRIFVATMAAMERKSEEGEGKEKVFLRSSAEANAERPRLSFVPWLSSLPPYGAVMYGFMNGGFTYFCRLKWRGGRGLKGKVPRARAVFLLVSSSPMVNRSR